MPKHQYGLPVTAADEALRKRTTKWHWGVPATQAVEWDDPDYPERMVEIGRLAELVLRPVGEQREQKIKIPKEYWTDFPKDGTHAKVNRGSKPVRRVEQTHLCFDADHPSQRLYICLPPDVMKAFAPAFTKGKAFLLADIAKNVGGRHAKHRDYPAVRGVVLGTLTHVIYHTYKKGDENPGNVRSLYDHHMGEDGGISPALVVDGLGRLWICGGSYKCGIPGISQ